MVIFYFAHATIFLTTKISHLASHVRSANNSKIEELHYQFYTVEGKEY